jgi:hypothetical protein
MMEWKNVFSCLLDGMPMVNATFLAGKVVGSISTLVMQNLVQSFLKN